MAQVPDPDPELGEVELTGERLTLRRWRRDDAARIAEALSDARMHRFIALPDPYTLDDATQFVTEVADVSRADGSALESAVVERVSGRLVGSAVLRLAGDPEIGFWVAPDAQRNGYAAEASTMLAGWAFLRGLRRVRLACDVRNLASARTALRAGFLFEGVSRGAVTSPGTGQVPSRYGDLARFARLPTDPAGPIAHSFAQLPSGGLTDGVLLLRAMEAADATQLAETDDELTLRWSFTGVAHTADEVARTAAQAGLQWLVGTVAAFSLVDVASGRVAGSLRLRKPGPPQVGGIGYVVHPAFRGRGYASRALRLLVPWAFETADFARLELGAKIGNRASLRAAETAGFTPDGTRRRRMRNPDATFTDELRYALVNPAYE